MFLLFSGFLICLKSSCSDKCKVCCDSCNFCALTRQSQQKGVSTNTEKVQIKPVKNASFVDLSPSVPPVTNVLSVVEGIPVGARVQKFWQVLAAKGLSPRAVLILTEIYSLKFKMNLLSLGEPLTRSAHANSLRNSYLEEALPSLLQKQTVGKVKIQFSPEFYNRLFFVPKPNQK